MYCASDGLPLAPSRETRSPPPRQLTFSDQPDDVSRVQFQDRLSKRLVSAGFPINGNAVAVRVADRSKNAFLDSGGIAWWARRMAADQGLGRCADNQELSADNRYWIIAATRTGHFFGPASQPLQ